MTKKCAICGKKLGLFDYKFPLKDGFICANDIIKFDFSKSDKNAAPTQNACEWFRSHTTNDLIELVKRDNSFKKVSAEMDSEKQKKAAEEQAKKAAYQRTLEDFKQNSLKVSHYYIRNSTQQILIAKTFLNDPKIVNFSDIASYEVNQRGHDEHKHHGITRALVGGALAGGVGAIIGATTGGSDKEYTDHLGLIITLKDGSNFEIPFLRIKDKTTSLNVKDAYSKMQDVISMIEAGMQATKEKSSNSSQVKDDVPSEIRKYKELADDGIISQEEFEAKKKQLLNL